MTEVLNITIDANSPKTIIRMAHDANIITQEEFEILVKAITRRNETSHAYNKDLAHEIIEEIPNFYETMHNVLERLNKQ